MRNFWHYPRHEEVNDGGGGGGAESYETESKEQPIPSENDSSTQGEGNSEFDELGYKIEKKGDQKPEGSGDDKKQTAPESKEEKPSEKSDPLPGYGDEEKSVEKPEEKPPEKKEEIKLEYDLNLETVPKEDADKLKEFASKHKLSKEQAQAYVDAKKEEVKQIATYRAEMQQKRNAKVKEWVQELKSDPNFGGEKYAHNVQQVGKVMQEFMSDFKNDLTKSGIVLPPNAIRGIKKIADALYGTKKMIQGDPPKGDKESERENPDAFLDDMYPEKKK